MTDDKNNDNNADNNSAFDDKICYKTNKNTMTAMTMISMKMMSTKNDDNNQNEGLFVHKSICLFVNVLVHYTCT